jgi:TrmH family RNA methyltransferase
MITSTRNPKIQWIRTLQSRSRARKDAQTFVIEGVRLCDEAQNAGWTPKEVLFVDGLNTRGVQIVDGFGAQGSEILQVTPQVMRAVSDTQTPQGIMAILPMRQVPIPEAANFFLILDGVGDPGNMGTILRTAYAAGVDGLLLPPGSVDPYSPKVVRSAMGAHFYLPLRRLPWDDMLPYLEGLASFMADSSQGIPYHQADFKQPLSLVIGSEARGPSPEARKLAGNRVHIPMPGEAESLNAAIATAVLLFEVVRQRGL